MRFLDMISGSFFRTIGRILAYIAIGIALAYFGSFIFISSVHAQEFDYAINAYINGDYAYAYYFVNGESVQLQSNVISTSKNMETNMSIDVELKPGMNYGSNFLVQATFCTTGGAYFGNVVTAGYDVSGGNLIKNYSKSTSNTTCFLNGYSGHLFTTNIAVSKDSSNNKFSIKLWGAIRADYNVVTQITNVYVTTFTEELAQQFEVNDKQDIINNSINSMKDKISNDLNSLKGSTDQTNEKLDKLNDNITSSDVDTSSSSSFFGDFSDEDNGGISGIITAPLRFVKKLTGTCEPLSITLFDTSIELPCGDTLFWGREDVQDFRTTWNVLVGGVLIYMLLIKLFKVIHNLKDPDNSKIEVMDL